MDRGEEPGSNPRGESEAYFKRILATAPIGIAIVRGRVVEDVNESFCVLSGYRREEIIGKTTRHFFMDDMEFDRVGQVLYVVEDHNEIRTTESKLRRRDGIFVDVILRIARFGDREPQEKPYVVVVMDIGERKRAEIALESRISALTSPEDPFGSESALRLETLFDLTEIQKIQDAFSSATGVASIITDTEGKPLTRPSNFTRFCSEIARGTEKGCEKCRRSDAAIGRVNPSGPIIEPCLSAGLLTGGAGISAGDRHIANWLIGQVLDESTDIEQIRSYAAEIGADQNGFDAALAEVPRMPKERFAKISEALFLIAQQLSGLAYNNIQQARAIVERRKAAEEKDALYRELKHRVKNGMALIAALVDLEAGRSESPEARAALAATRARIESLATLYDVLGGSEDPTEIRLDTYLARIVQVVEGAFDEAIASIDFHCELRPIVVPARSAAPLGLILMELLTNAVKYAFPSGEGGSVRIRLDLDEGNRTAMIVEDDGIGLPDGFDPKKSSGLGMELILMLTSQLDGEFTIGDGNGARFLVRLPADSGRAGGGKAEHSV